MADNISENAEGNEQEPRSEIPRRIMHNVEESCELLGGVSRAFYYNLISDGTIRTIKLRNGRLTATTELERVAAELAK